MTSIHVPIDDSNVPIALRKGIRTYTQHPMFQIVSSHYLSTTFDSFGAQTSSVSISQTLRDALKDPKWKKFMIEEMRALQKNSTWELTRLPRGKKKAGYKWIFTIKHKVSGSIERYKARLIAKGFT